MLEKKPDAPKRMKEFTETVRSSDLYPENPINNSATTEATIWMDGREHLLFCSNNLLGLSNRADVEKTAEAALERYGLGSGGSRRRRRTSK